MWVAVSGQKYYFLFTKTAKEQCTGGIAIGRIYFSFFMNLDTFQ